MSGPYKKFLVIFLLVRKGSTRHRLPIKVLSTIAKICRFYGPLFEVRIIVVLSFECRRLNETIFVHSYLGQPKFRFF